MLSCLSVFCCFSIIQVAVKLSTHYTFTTLRISSMICLLHLEWIRIASPAAIMSASVGLPSMHFLLSCPVICTDDSS